MDVTVVSTVEDYRNLARQKLVSGSSILEIGCSTGETTRLLAEHADHVFSVDSSLEMIQHARQAVADLTNVQVEHIDGRDTAALADLVPDPDGVFIDIGGNQHLDKIATVVRGILRRFSSRFLIVRNYELAELAAMVSGDHTAGLQMRPRMLSAETERDGMIENLLSLCNSYIVSNRTFALRKLKEHIAAPGVRAVIEAMCGDESPTVRRLARGILLNLPPRA